MGDIVLSQKTQWLADARAAAQRAVNLRAEIGALIQQWNSDGYLHAETGLIEADYTGTVFEGLTKAQLDLVASTFAAYETWINAGHDDILAKIR